MADYLYLGKETHRNEYDYIKKNKNGKAIKVHQS